MEIVVRAGVIYLFLWFVLRVMGKRELAEMTAFELVVLVMVGDLAQQGVTQENMSVTGTALAVSTFGLLAVGASLLSRRLPAAPRILDGRPSVILRRGTLIPETLAAMRMSVEDVREAARQHGYRSLADLDWIIVEDDGRFSFIEPRREPD